MSIQKYTDKLIKVNSTDLAQPYSTWGHFYSEIYGYSCTISSCGYDYGFILPVKMQVRTMTTSRVAYFIA